jgi:hypothetical protein
VIAVVLVALPLLFICFLVGSYNWDKYHAARAMRAATDTIMVGDSLDDVRQLVERADAEAVNQPFGNYLLARSNNLPGPSVSGLEWAVRGFWLRTGITCYLEFAVEGQVVTQVEDIYCVNDGWLE